MSMLENVGGMNYMSVASKSIYECKCWRMLEVWIKVVGEGVRKINPLNVVK